MNYARLGGGEDLDALKQVLWHVKSILCSVSRPGKRILRAFLVSFELVMGSRKRLFVYQVDFTLIFSLQHLEKLSFWIPAFARMTGLYQSDKLTTYYLQSKNSILAPFVETRFIASESVITSLGIDCQECILLGRRDKSRLYPCVDVSS